MNETPSIDEIVHGEVAFYAHTILRRGIVDGIWEKIGKSNTIDKEQADAIFYTNVLDLSCLPPKLQPQDDSPIKWRTWQINQEALYYNFLPQEILDRTEIGTIIANSSILDRFER